METGSPFGTIQPQSSKQRKQSDLKPTRAQLVVIIAFVGILLLGAAGFFVYKKGEESGKKIGRKESTMNFNNPFGMLNGSNALPIKTFTGKITKKQDDKITIKESTSGDEHEVNLNDKTKVKQKTDQKKLTDLTENQSVTVYTSESKTGGLTATLVLIK